ncbi:hypothetical protein JH06_0749 [Blastocystis sp. subtype 4]|uniref:hypothetical protein n=1 Tax=Blastocystis sp. subtype 4 TaxID=944170 RepID=UPI000711D567|nr:hypothetical protein JH06_0749 [Blastocystis sp. subtype 4]KNB45711.1 hypothetical protein JH06_0749 [Blastocystis sp. subtype 4]|eukprot:XP_014529154.1 hypothetical protein JH06_0749 [Blastocystis sp. subtype 4]
MEVEVWDPSDVPVSETSKEPFELAHTISLHKGPISCVKYSSDGDYLAIASIGLVSSY